MDQADIPALLSRLVSDEEAARKMAVFKLQSSINDPAFADVFISSGGLVVLRRMITNTSGNTLAYALQSLSRLLEVDMGWEMFECTGACELLERVVELICTNPLVNILRGAMSILAAFVGHTQSSPRGAYAGPKLATKGVPGAFGLRALKPAVTVYPHFFELVIQQLHSADHALCASALTLVNALIRDAVSNEGGSPTGGKSAAMPEEWSKFIKKLQDLGLIKAVYKLIQSSSLQDLAVPLLEFQSLTRVLLKKWREVRVDLERPEHRRALKGLHLASAPERRNVNGRTGDDVEGKRGSGKHNPEKWRRLGFESESPANEFNEAGFLGMMDLTDYVRKNEDGFQKLLLEQSNRPLHERCPVARASLAVTMILYEHFEVEKTDLDEVRLHQASSGTKASERAFRPMLLQWSRIHTAALYAFFQIWKATGAVCDDLDKVAELVRILVEQVIGQASRTRDMVEVEEDLHELDCGRLREVQMNLLELGLEEHWGQHLHQVREELKHEALQFVKEQRIRCLLQGSWFSKPQPRALDSRASSQVKRLYLAWRFVKLSPNRRYLHYADFDDKLPHDPGLDALTDKVDLGTISSVVSNVSNLSNLSDESAASEEADADAESTLIGHSARKKDTDGGSQSTKITIYSFATDKNGNGNCSGSGFKSPDPGCSLAEKAILTLSPPNHSLASEWLDGLLMLLNQAPITAETNKLVTLVSEYGLNIRLLNVRLEAVYAGPPPGAGVVPSRDGLDEDYFYDL